MSILSNFNYQLDGNPNGKKLVFLHGLMGAGVNWRTISRNFTDQFHILTYDQRGHGRSFHPESGYQPSDFANDLNDILVELGWDSIYLVGHSMGGRNAMNFAYRFGEKLQALVVEDIGPNSSEEAIDAIRQILESVPTPFISRAEARRFFMNDFKGLHPNNPRAHSLGQFLYTNIEEGSNGEADWRFSREGIWEACVSGRVADRWEEWKGIQVPTLLIRGSESKELPQEVYDEMLHCNSIAKGVVVEDSGHWIHSEHPVWFAKLLSDFFEQIACNISG